MLRTSEVIQIMSEPKNGVRLNLKLIRANLRAWRKQDLKAGIPVDFKGWLSQWKLKNAKVVHGR